MKHPVITSLAARVRTTAAAQAADLAETHFSVLSVQIEADAEFLTGWIWPYIHISR